MASLKEAQNVVSYPLENSLNLLQTHSMPLLMEPWLPILPRIDPDIVVVKTLKHARYRRAASKKKSKKLTCQVKDLFWLEDIYHMEGIHSDTNLKGMHGVRKKRKRPRSPEVEILDAGEMGMPEVAVPEIPFPVSCVKNTALVCGRNDDDDNNSNNSNNTNCVDGGDPRFALDPNLLDLDLVDDPINNPVNDPVNDPLIDLDHVDDPAVAAVNAPAVDPINNDLYPAARAPFYNALGLLPVSLLSGPDPPQRFPPYPVVSKEPVPPLRGGGSEVGSSWPVHPCPSPQLSDSGNGRAFDGRENSIDGGETATSDIGISETRAFVEDAEAVADVSANVTTNVPANSGGEKIRETACGSLMFHSPENEEPTPQKQTTQELDGTSLIRIAHVSGSSILDRVKEEPGCDLQLQSGMSSAYASLLNLVSTSGQPVPAGGSNEKGLNTSSGLSGPVESERPSSIPTSTIIAPSSTATFDTILRKATRSSTPSSALFSPSALDGILRNASTRSKASAPPSSPSPSCSPFPSSSPSPSSASPTVAAFDVDGEKRFPLSSPPYGSNYSKTDSSISRACTSNSKKAEFRRKKNGYSFTITENAVICKLF